MEENTQELVPIRLTKSKRFPHAGIFAALLLLAGAVVWAVTSGKSALGADEHRPLRADFKTVWSWSDPEFAGGATRAQWSFRWDGAVRLAEAKSFASGLGIQLSDQLKDGGPIDVEAADSDYKLTLWIHSRQANETDKNASDPAAEAGKQLYDLVLLLDASEHAEKQALLDAIGKVEDRIAHSGVDLRGGFTVKGTAAAEGAGGRIARIASAKQTEAYADDNTSSLTYFSDKLGSQVQSGSRPVNLQIAESLSDDGKAPELVIGMPLITGDYAMAAK